MGRVNAVTVSIGLVAASVLPAAVAAEEASLPIAMSVDVGVGALFMDYPYAAAPTPYSVEGLTILGGGDFVLPLDGLWNLQFSASHRMDEIPAQASGQFRHHQTNISALAYWREQHTGLFGLEAGLYSEYENRPRLSYKYARLGAVAEYFLSDQFTVGAFGGWMTPIDAGPQGIGSLRLLDDGLYAGGHVTYYAADNLAVSALGRFYERNLDTTDTGFNSRTTVQTVRAGGKIRYLTSMPGVELFAYGGYVGCEQSFSGSNNGSPITGSESSDNAEFLVGVNIRIGGRTDSLSAIDRSNAVDTRIWACDMTRYFRRGR